MFGTITMEQKHYTDYITYLSNKVNNNDVKVVYYMCHTVSVKNVILRIARNFYCQDKLERILAKKSGGHMDNHTAYEVTFADGSTLIICFDDYVMSIGVGIDKDFN